MHHYEHKYGENKIPKVILIFMTLWFTILGTSTTLMYKDTGTLEVGLFIFIGMSVLFFGILILSIKRSNVFVYRDYLKVRSTFGSKEIQFYDIELIDYMTEYRSNSNNSGVQVKRYIDLYDMYDKRLARINTHLLGHHNAQRDFIQLIRDRNRSVKLTDEASMFVGDEPKRYKSREEELQATLQDAVNTIEIDPKILKFMKVIGFSIAGLMILLFFVPMFISLIFALFFK